MEIMNNSQRKNDEESLARSHSKSSNALLTLLCFLTSLALALLWVGLALLGKEDTHTLGLLFTICGAIVTGLGIVGGVVFKR